MIKLDDLNPSNTFERRLLEYLVAGHTLPIKIEHSGVDLKPIHDRIARLEQVPVPSGSGEVPGLEQRFAALERQHAEALRQIQMLATALDALLSTKIYVPVIREVG